MYEVFESGASRKMQERMPRPILDHEIVLVVGLQVPQRYPSRLFAMDRDEAG
jgi:hypothetical protein